MSIITQRDRYQMTVSNTPGTGSFTIGSATTGYRKFGTGDNNLYFDVVIVDGTNWEIDTYCQYTTSGTSLSRGTFVSSSTGSAISFTSSAIITVCALAEHSFPYVGSSENNYDVLTWVIGTGWTNSSYISNSNLMGFSGGDVTSAVGSGALYLNTVNSNIGTFNTVTINAKGLVTSASNTSYLTANQSITLSGDISGSGTTSISGTLATVTQGSGSNFVKITLDTKGRVTGNTAVAQSDITGLLGAGSITNTMLANGAVANLSGTNTGDQTITLTGAVTGSGTGSFATTIANSGVTAGTYNATSSTITPFTVNAAGQITTTPTKTTTMSDFTLK